MKAMNTTIKDLCALVLLCAFCVPFLSSCDALDEAPDNRTEITTPDKVRQLLTSAYPAQSPAVLCELSGDNLLDDNVVVPATHNAAMYKFHEEAYMWEDIEDYSTNVSDTPYQIWEAYYQGISVCNHAIAAMQEMSTDPANDLQLAHSWGEAHVLRAYLHFVLVSLFAEAYKDEARSSADRGVPYVTIPETVVHVDYSTSEFLHDVKTTYDLIEKDLLEGIDLIDDSKYKIPAYHFNRNAANAFAARFYLFKRDYTNCLKYANAALGANPVLRNWRAINVNTLASAVNDYNDETQPWNYLIQSTYSYQWRMMVSNARFAINEGTTFKSDGKSWRVGSTLTTTMWGPGPNWSSTLPAYSGMVYINGAGQQFGAWLFRLYEYFEYTDKIAGIGYIHQLYQPFNADETILCRAEAKLYLGDQQGAIDDLNTWTSSHLVTKTLELADIRKRYNRANKDNDYVSELHPAEMGFEKVLTGDDLSVLDCILHFRRAETVHEGHRWFDIKRYGIKIYHHYRGPNEDDIHTDSLTWDDPRRVLQVPNNVIESGYPSNRTNSAVGGGSGAGYVIQSPKQTIIPKLYQK